MKKVIGDLLSLIVGDNSEDYEPSKNEYIMFWMIVGVIGLFTFGYMLS